MVCMQSHDRIFSCKGDLLPEQGDVEELGLSVLNRGLFKLSLKR